jgi:virginiamycin B lyase
VIIRVFRSVCGLQLFLILIVSISGLLSAQISATTVYSIAPNANVFDIAKGPDGAMWFTSCEQLSCASSAIGRITADGVVNEYSTPKRFPGMITTGADGSLWFTDALTNSIGRICANTSSACGSIGSVIEYPINTPLSVPGAIRMASDGTLWFVELATSQIGRFCVIAGSVSCPFVGSITEYPVPNGRGATMRLASGPDGAMWFTEAASGKIGRICVAVALPTCPEIGSTSEYVLPTPNSSPNDITTGPDGALWFTEGIGQIGRITIGGQISEYPANRGYDSPTLITTGPDGALWFISIYATYYNYVGRMTTDGSFPSFSDAGVWPTGLTSGSDGSLWVSGWYSSNAIEKITLIPKPIVIVVPGFGASTLTDANGVDQWLSCDSILSLHNGPADPLGSLDSLKYDINGNPAAPLNPREILTQSDAISNTGKFASQSILQCSDNPSAGADISLLVNDVACSGGSFDCFLARGVTTVANLQNDLVSASHGALLQFNDPTNSLLGTLANNGFSPQAWKYDFRRDISALADDLYTEIENTSSTDSGRPVVIVAHSEGSIVTAAMLAQHPNVYPKMLTSIISMGAPFLGAIDAYLYAQGWDRFLSFMSNSNTALLGQNWTSVYQLLPQWQFFTPIQPPSPSVATRIDPSKSPQYGQCPRRDRCSNATHLPELVCLHWLWLPYQ